MNAHEMDLTERLSVYVEQHGPERGIAFVVQVLVLNALRSTIAAALAESENSQFDATMNRIVGSAMQGLEHILSPILGDGVFPASWMDAQRCVHEIDARLSTLAVIKRAKE